MKVNEAPEKLYFPFENKDDVETLELYSEKYSNEEIEYTRTDAFMKKAKEAFCKAMCQGKPPRSTCTSLGTCKEYDNFINYMKGE